MTEQKLRSLALQRNEAVSALTNLKGAIAACVFLLSGSQRCLEYPFEDIELGLLCIKDSLTDSIDILENMDFKN